MLLAIGSLQILSASHLAWEGPFLHLINLLICNNIYLSYSCQFVDEAFSSSRNLICVYSKKHMNDYPELIEMKRRSNTRSLKEMALLLRYYSLTVTCWFFLLFHLYILSPFDSAVLNMCHKLVPSDLSILFDQNIIHVKPMQHQYGYVYQYQSNTGTSFSKTTDTDTFHKIPKKVLCRMSHSVFKTKIRCSSYVCPGLSCHTYGQNVSTEYQCLYYIVSYYKNLLQVQKGLNSGMNPILP
jgi:hypothetical protein